MGLEMERFRQDPARGEGGVSSGSDAGSALLTGGAQRVSVLFPPSLLLLLSHFSRVRLCAGLIPGP